MKQRTWQRCVIGIGSSSFNSDTVEIIGARWRRRLVWKEKKGCELTKTRKDKEKKECLGNEERIYALGQLGGRA